MKTPSSLSQLKNHLESAAFLVSRGNCEREAHLEIVHCLVIVAELEATTPDIAARNRHTEIDDQEVIKVRRRLKLWAKRPSQINSKILNAYLELQRSGAKTITETSLKEQLPEERSFESNFSQMKIIAEKNHGKIFEQYGDIITIWPPVLSDVQEYERIVFGRAA